MDSKFGSRYKVIEEIGKGGMGKVYKVFDSVRDSIVALKEMTGKRTGHHSVLSFKNEYHVQSKFVHPNTVKVFDFGTTSDNTPFITMEYIEGETLNKKKNLSVDKVIEIIGQICRAVSVIHSRRYVHRDLKPSNMKLTSKGLIKLLDFGLMCQVGAASREKMSGTYYYMAPEAITGSIIDERADLYSIGVIAYELLTGKPPFTGTREEILEGHLKKTPLPPSVYNKAVPSYVNQIVLKLLEKDKDLRYRYVTDVLSDLSSYTSTVLFLEKPGEMEGYLYCSRLIGRKQEIENFQSRLLNLKEGSSSAFYVGAAAGIGKTRLMNEMKMLAELEGAETIYIDDVNAEDRAYGWIDQLIKRVDGLLKDRKLECSGISVEKGVLSINNSKAENVTDLVVAKLQSCLSTLSIHKPILIMFDNLQWMDIKSIEILNSLIMGIDEFRGIIAGAFRNDEVEKSSPLWNPVEENLVDYVELSPLDKTNVHEMLNALLYPSKTSGAFLDLCFSNSGGNVFDLIEFLKYLIFEGHLVKAGIEWKEPVDPEGLKLPDNVDDRLVKRIEGMGTNAFEAASTAAVVNEELDVDIWFSTLDFEEEKFLNVIDELRRNQIILVSEGRYQFFHDKIHQIIYSIIPEKKKKLFHKRAAEFIEKKINSEDVYMTSEAARHYSLAGEGKKAIDFSLRAAKIAEEGKAEWEAFHHYKNAAFFLEKMDDYEERDKILLDIYTRATGFASAAWIDAKTCLEWLNRVIDHFREKNDLEKVFSISLGYIVTSSITSNYAAARKIIPEVIDYCKIEKDTLKWAVLFGSGVCLTNWYEGRQQECFDHSIEAIRIFEENLENLPDELWPAYTWALFWRDKARAYMGMPIVMENVEKIKSIVDEGKSDPAIYWHTLTAVGARAAFSGRYQDLLEWKDLASRLSREMGRIYWFECWISHSYLYGALHYGDFSQLEKHIERVEASPDPYQVRLAHLFRGRLRLIQGKFIEAEKSFDRFFEMEKLSPDNSYLEGVIYKSKLYLETGRLRKAADLIAKGAAMAEKGKYANPLYQLQFNSLAAMLALGHNLPDRAIRMLKRSLSIAGELDNPLRRGFVHELLANAFKMKGESGKAEDEIKKARNCFISIGNKYQSARAYQIQESWEEPEKGIHRAVSEEKGDNLLDDTELDTVFKTIDESISGSVYGDSVSSYPVDEKTVSEEGLDKTEVED